MVAPPLTVLLPQGRDGLQARETDKLRKAINIAALANRRVARLLLTAASQRLNAPALVEDTRLKAVDERVADGEVA